MGALQVQATEKDASCRRRARMTALGRADEDELGQCRHCGEAIAESRRSLDAAASPCVACAEGRTLRPRGAA